MDVTGEAGRSDLCQRVIKSPLREAGDPIHHCNNETKMNSSILTLLNSGGRLTSPPAAQLARSCFLSALVQRHQPHHPPQTHTHTPLPPSLHSSPSWSNFLQKSNASATLFSISPFQGSITPSPSHCWINKWMQPQPSRHQSFHSSVLFFFIHSCKSHQRSIARHRFVYCA